MLLGWIEGVPGGNRGKAHVDIPPPIFASFLEEDRRLVLAGKAHDTTGKKAALLSKSIKVGLVLEAELIEHRHPTTSTAKQLYGRALRCAHPSCVEPLYREDERSGEWTLNSRICHINARSENGPRWDPSQAEEDNRSEANLVLMCVTHASAIDDPANVSSYTEELLREWKQLQLEEHKAASQGWQLTESMARDALSHSYPDFTLNIENSELTLGGTGGQAPGSGGGGGGAIGPGAKAGNGGKGGDLHIENDDPTLRAMLSEYLKKDDGPAPGAGGAGAGATGPETIAGDGGDGGDLVVGKTRSEAGDRFEIEVGKGGSAARLPGQHGERGGDTVLRQVAADGTIKKEMRAKGGEGAKVGALPDDCVPITQDEISDGFRISTLMAVNSVEARDGLLFILGGGWSTVTVRSLPQDVVFPVVCSATWKNLASGKKRGLHLTLSSPSGEEVARQPLILPDIETTSYYWTLPIGAKLNCEGPWSIAAITGDVVLSEFDCAVVLNGNGPKSSNDSPAS